MTHVRIHYATNDGDYRWEAVADQPRNVVFDGEIVSIGADRRLLASDRDLVLCETIYSAFNRHDAADQHPVLDEKGLRSLSVGDVVEIVADPMHPGDETRYYLCANAGFDRISGIPAEPEVHDATTCAICRADAADDYWNHRITPDLHPIARF